MLGDTEGRLLPEPSLFDGWLALDPTLERVFYRLFVEGYLKCMDWESGLRQRFD